jgi:hypothetical protein
MTSPEAIAILVLLAACGVAFIYDTWIGRRRNSVQVEN